MLYFAICAKLWIETSRTVSRRSMSVSFLLFYRALSTIESSRYFAPRAFTIRSTFCRRGSGRENDDDDGDDDDVAGSPA